jgi:hypothetical protein
MTRTRQQHSMPRGRRPPRLYPGGGGGGDSYGGSCIPTRGHHGPAVHRASMKTTGHGGDWPNDSDRAACSPCQLQPLHLASTPYGRGPPSQRAALCPPGPAPAIRYPTLPATRPYFPHAAPWRARRLIRPVAGPSPCAPPPAAVTVGRAHWLDPVVRRRGTLDQRSPPPVSGPGGVQRACHGRGASGRPARRARMHR